MTKHTIATATAAAALFAVHANAPKKTEGVAAAATADAAKTAAPRVAPIIAAIRADIAIPAAKSINRGSKSPFPFDALEVGQSFGVGNKTAKQMSSIVSNQNRAKGNQTPRKDATGAIVMKMRDLTDAGGAVIGKVPTSEPETDWIKEFRAFDVDAKTDPDNASVRVFRIK